MDALVRFGHFPGAFAHAQAVVVVAVAFVSSRCTGWTDSRLRTPFFQILISFGVPRCHHWTHLVAQCRMDRFSAPCVKCRLGFGRFDRSPTSFGLFGFGRFRHVCWGANPPRGGLLPPTPSRIMRGSAPQTPRNQSVCSISRLMQSIFLQNAN